MWEQYKRYVCIVRNEVIDESTWGFPGVTVTHSLQPWSFSSPINGRICTATFTLQFSDEASFIYIICVCMHIHVYAVWIYVIECCGMEKCGCYRMKRKWEKGESWGTRGGDLKNETRCVKQTQANRYIHMLSSPCCLIYILFFLSPADFVYD